MYFFRHFPSILAVAVVLSRALPGAADAPAKPALVAEFGTVTLDISGAKAFSRFIAEKHTIKKIKKSTAEGVMRFRQGARGSYRVVTVASGKIWDEQGTFQTTVCLEVPCGEGVLRLTATGERRWIIPPNQPQAWLPDDPEPRFRGPDAKAQREEWRRDAPSREQERTLLQNQQRDAERWRAIRDAFEDSLQDARDKVESQLRQALSKRAVVPTPAS